ncbi:MAG: TGS domain-containing protein, partial [Ginsengibacter sp.]
MMNITFPDGAVRQYEQGVSAMDIAKSISEGLARRILAAEVNGEIWDLSRPLNNDASIKFLTWEDAGGKSTFWHSSAHLMAEAVEDTFPGVKFWVGPPIEKGFYYDIDLGDNVITETDLVKLEKKMAELSKQNNPYIRKEISKADAIQYFEEKGDEYKLDLLSNLQDGNITFYTQGKFTDLCRGPHIPSTGFIKGIKLTSIAGAYWKGDEKNKMLTRIYGVTFPNQKELDEYIVFLEEAKKRDHRKIGKELELFTFSEKVGQGLPLWLPKGAMLRGRLQEFMQKAQLEAGYLPVVTPHIGSKNLYVTSGHYEKYGADSFQ